ncbi:MAG: hypothetical protein ACI4MH_00805 [Candidatus Coproplasma sp.]
MNLLKADFYHLIKSKVFYVLLALTFLMPLLTCVMFPEMTVEKIIFQGLDTTLFCSVIGIMLALFVGKDYDNNTIRNKICYGEKRGVITAVTFTEGVIICLIFVAVSVISSLVFGSIICNFSFSADFAAKFLCQLLILLAFSTAVTAITVCTKSMKIGLIIALMISIVLSSVGQMLPMLAVTNNLAALLCRIIYSTVSSNLLNSTGGVYEYISYANGASATFSHMYLNSIILAVVYILVAVGVTAVVVKKQSYK